MIVSASYRTDIPAFHADWFRARLADGVCRVANPYGGKPFSVALRGDGVDGYVFWTRNTAPFADAFDDVAALGLPIVVQFTVTRRPYAAGRRRGRPDRGAGAEIRPPGRGLAVRSGGVHVDDRCRLAPPEFRPAVPRTPKFGG